MSADTWQRVLRRNRWLTGLAMAGLIVTMATIAFAYRSRHRKEDVVAVARGLPSNVEKQTSGYSFTSSDRGQRVFTIRASRTIAWKQGDVMVLEDVFVEFFGRENHRDTMRTGQCEYHSQSGDIFSPGKVQIELNAVSDPSEVGSRTREGGQQAVLIESSRVSFTNATKFVSTDQPVTFRAEAVSGSAGGLAYAVKDGRLELKSSVKAELTTPGRQPEGQSPVKLNASKVRYDKSTGEIDLDGPVEILQGERQIAAEKGKVLLDRQNRIERAVLDGAVRGRADAGEQSIQFSASHVEGGFDSESALLTSVMAEGNVDAESRTSTASSRLTTQRFDVALTGRNPAPTNATARGNSHLTIEPVAGRRDGSGTARMTGETKSLAAPEMRFAFRTGGKSLEATETVGKGKLAITPHDPKAGERIMTAGQFLMSFDGQSRLKSLRGRGHTHLRLEVPPMAPPGSLPRETSSDRLDAALDPATGVLQAVDQTGNFRFQEGDRQGSADQGQYVASTQLVTLKGHPQLWDPTGRIRAEHIVFDMGTDTAEAVGRVQGTHFEAADSTKPHRTASPPAPVSADPTNILADRMVAERGRQRVHYEGHVRAWQGQNMIKSPSLDVDLAQRRLSSESRVLTSFLRSSSHPSAPVARVSSSLGRAAQPVTIAADHLEYLDLGRRASYRGNVQLISDDTTLRTDHLDVYLSQPSPTGGSEIEHAVADGHVTVVQPGRRALSEHADYEAAQAGQERIVLTGGQPSLYDAQKGFTTGYRLTFYTRDDTLLVDGENKSPTLSKHRVAQ